MTDEMLVEAVARALDPELWDYAGPDDWNGARERARHRASRALSALPPEMRAAGEMKRARSDVLALRRGIALLNRGGGGAMLSFQSDEIAALIAAATEALALASSPGQQSTKDGEEG